MNFFRRYTLFFSIVILQFSSYSQNWNAIYSKELDAEYLIFTGNFAEAGDKYVDIHRLIPESANITFKAGCSYLYSDEKKHLAIELLEEACKKISPEYDPRGIREMNAPPEAYYFLGKAYQIAERFEDAIRAFKVYETYIDPSHYNWDLIEQQITSCEIAPNLYNSPVPFRISNMGDVINDENSNFNAVFSGDGKTMAYTTISYDGYNIFISNNTNGDWNKPKNITDDVRAENMITASISFDGTKLILVDNYSDYRDIYISELVDKKWEKAYKLKKPVNSKYFETHASLSADGNTMYFTSDRPGGVGGLDIYKSSLDGKGKWSTPENLGTKVNTKFDEEVPFITYDNKFLFFSSQGHTSIGGFDVFYIDAINLDEPVNVGYPINNSDDNFFFPIDRYNGHMALYNEKSLGNRDIFRFKLLPWVELVTEVNFTGDQQLKPNEVNLQLLDIEENVNVVDKKSGLTEANFSKKLKPGKYQLTITGDGLENYIEEFIIPEEYNEKSYNYRVVLTASAPATPLLADSNTATEVASAVESIPEPEVTTEPLAVNQPLESVDNEEITAEATEVIPENIPQPDPEDYIADSKLPSVETNSSSRKVEATPFSSEEATGEFFTVQIMALRNPVEIDFFQNVKNVNISKGSDEFYRYTVGLFSSAEEAKPLQLDLQQKGYKDAFIRPIAAVKGYTIQIMALAVPRDISFFKNLAELQVTKGEDELHRYTFGNYSTLEQAKSELEKVIQLGYKDAFIRKIIKREN